MKPPVAKQGDGVKLSTFLGSPYRDFYGLGPVPAKLDVLWSVEVGSGQTSDPFKDDAPVSWSGTGWTGQPALVRDGGRDYLLIGGYDHGLRKIDARSGEVVWRHEFDDVIKGSPSVFENPRPNGKADRYIVIGGSRRGFPLPLDSPDVAPYRALAFGTGKELWRLPVPQTSCYSRDCDGSGFFLEGRQYIGVESGWFYALDPLQTQAWQGHRSPVVEESRLLIGDEDDAEAHYDPVVGADNLVLEASPALLGETIYIASGAGHVYGLARDDLEVVFDFRTGSDLDGTTVPTAQGKLLVSIEKQYIPGHGGVMLLDPRKPAGESPVWYFPTGDEQLGEWEGGVLGSVAVNDVYNRKGRRPRLAAFIAIDGNVYVVSQDALAGGSVKGPDSETDLPTPQLVFKDWVGGGISTPVIVDDTLIAAGYEGVVHAYRLSYPKSRKGAEGALPCPDGAWRSVKVREMASVDLGGSIESSPIVWDGRVYIGCRNGSFYCLGES
jgi:outer membrane protein assembly factor BamB